MDTKMLISLLRFYAEGYRTPPLGREIQGTEELLDDAADKLESLAAYEETGMDPEAILQLKKIAEILNCSANDPAQLNQLLDKLQNWADSWREDRLVVTPVNLGQKVWFLLEDSPCFYPDTNGWFISEETITEVGTNGFCTEEGSYLFPFADIGKCIFLTREEAETALEGENNGTE